MTAFGWRNRRRNISDQNDSFIFSLWIWNWNRREQSFGVRVLGIQVEAICFGLFNNLAPGFLDANFLKANANGVATDADDRIIYSTTTGALLYDSNGNAVGGAVQFATLAGHPATIVAADFLVI